MKKSVLFTLLLVLMVSCHREKINLELNLTVGGIYTQKLSSVISISQQYNGQPVNINMTVEGKMSYTVLDTVNSEYTMDVKYESLIMKMDLPNGTKEFDSGKADTSDLFSTVLSCMINKPFTVKMSRTGKVNQVTGIDSIFYSILNGFPQIPAEKVQQITNQLKETYGEKSFKGNFEICSAIFPGKIVGKGDKWNIDTKLESGMVGNIETTYELKEINDTYCLLSGNSKISTENKNETIQNNGMEMKYNLSGTMTSEIKTNRKTGWVIESKINQNITGSVFIKDITGSSEGVNMPMELKNQMTLTGN